jgi:5-hydroxyisourate hydrolase
MAGVTISTHVLDIERGRPASGVPVALARRAGDGWTSVGEGITNADGRIAALAPAPQPAGTYRLEFDVAAYLQARDGAAPYLQRVCLEVVLDADQHYHIPLLLSRYACTSYRGS